MSSPAAPPAPASSWRLKEGWLAKRGHLFKAYKRRFFVLEGGNLLYFAKLGDPKSKGVIPLAGATVIGGPGEPGADETQSKLLREEKGVIPLAGATVIATNEVVEVCACSELWSGAQKRMEGRNDLTKVNWENAERRNSCTRAKPKTELLCTRPRILRCELRTLVIQKCVLFRFKPCGSVWFAARTPSPQHSRSIAQLCVGQHGLRTPSPQHSRSIAQFVGQHGLPVAQPRMERPVSSPRRRPPHPTPAIAAS